MKKAEARRIADLNLKEIFRILKEIDTQTEGDQQGIVIATYTKDEFDELKPGEDYELFKLIERYVIEDLASAGIDNVFFQQIDSVAYYKFLAENNLEHNQASISHFANITYMKNRDNKNGSK